MGGVISGLITDAYREGNIIAKGKTPDSDQQAEALAKINSFVNQFFGYGIGEELNDWLVPQPQRTAGVAAQWPFDPSTLNDQGSSVYPYPPVNSRLVYGGSTMTVYFPESPGDGARMGLVQGSGGTAGDVLTLDGNGRTIAGSATQVVTQPVAATEWFYRADAGDWVKFAALTTTDVSPFPDEFDELVSLYAFFRLAPRYGKSPTQAQSMAFKALQDTATTRYRQYIKSVNNETAWRSGRQSFASRSSGSWMQ